MLSPASAAFMGLGGYGVLILLTIAGLPHAGLRGVASRRGQTAESYSAVVAFACAMILVKSVHTA